MGTPEFAIPVLNLLIGRYDVVAVVTQPDKPKGRGNKVTASPIKELAVKSGIPVLQPDKVRTPEFETELAGYNADLFVTAAYGKILPENILKLPKSGCINVHASILPSYRGAAPLWWVLINGEKKAGVTTMMTDVGMDTGDILLKRIVDIDDDMNMGQLHDILSEEGAIILAETLDKLENGTLVRIPQDNSLASNSPMITKDQGKIDWNKSSREIHNLVRGTNPWPIAFTFLENEKLKIWKTSIVNEDSVDDAPGTILRVSNDGIVVATGVGIIKIIELQGESSRKMAIGEYINGHKINVGSILRCNPDHTLELGATIK